MKNSQMYLIRFKADTNGFSGWNAVYATSLVDAKKKLLDKCGQNSFNRIDWTQLKKGKEAEAIDIKLEKQYYGMFD